MRVRVLGDHDTVLALRLAGIKGRAVDGDEDPRPALEELIAEPDLGVLLVTGPLAERMRERVDEVMLVRSFPLVLEIPAKGVRFDARHDLIDEVARMVGIRV